MVVSDLLAILQVVIVFTMLLMTLMAFLTSRRVRTLQQAYGAMASMLLVASALCEMWLVLTVRPSCSISEVSYWLAFSLPLVALVLFLGTVKRTLDKRAQRSWLS